MSVLLIGILALFGQGQGCRVITASAHGDEGIDDVVQKMQQHSSSGCITLDWKRPDLSDRGWAKLARGLPQEFFVFKQADHSAYVSFCLSLFFSASWGRRRMRR